LPFAYEHQISWRQPAALSHLGFVQDRKTYT